MQARLRLSSRHALHVTHTHVLSLSCTVFASEPLRKGTPEQVLQSMRRATRTIGGQLRRHSKAGEKYLDQPNSPDPVSMSHWQLRKVGRSPSSDYFLRSHLVHRVDERESVYFVMPRSLVREVDDTPTYEEAPDEAFGLTAQEAATLAACHLQGDFLIVQALWESLGIIWDGEVSHTSWSFKRWRALRYDYVIVVVGAEAQKFWRSEDGSASLCSYKPAALWTLCEHIQVALEVQRGRVVLQHSKRNKGGRPCKSGRTFQDDGGGGDLAMNAGVMHVAGGDTRTKGASASLAFAAFPCAMPGAIPKSSAHAVPSCLAGLSGAIAFMP